MKIYPAIDIKDGKCVRLRRGDANEVRDYGEPLDWALEWQRRGAEYLHIVDLDAAFAEDGCSSNREIIKEIVHQVKIPVQVGGGIRSQENIKLLIEKVGVSRVVIGTMALENPEFVAWARQRYGDRIAVGIDAKEGKVVTRGWVHHSEKDAVELAQEMHALGIDTIIYTDIMRDGMLSGPNIQKTEEIVKKTWMNVIASGGVSTVEDIKRVRDTGACGVIIGKALYEGSMTFDDAMKARK